MGSGLSLGLLNVWCYKTDLLIISQFCYLLLQLEQANKYIADWTAYSNSQQEAYNAEVVKTTQLTKDIEEKTAALEDANKKLQDVIINHYISCRE